MPFPFVPVIMAAASMASQLFQNRANKRQADRAYERDTQSTDVAYGRELELMKYQNTYNTPLAQMQRFKDAGLNPNLVYGQGSPGNMQSTPKVPQQAPARVAQVSMPDVAMLYQDARLKAAQTDLISSKTDESGIKQELMKVQKEVAAANPYLAPGYVDALVSQLKSTAAMKEQEATYNLDFHKIEAGQDTGVPMGIAKMQRQFDILDQKYRLGEKDMQVKAQIIQSKEFQNDLAEIQREWMKDGKITPQHIYQFAMMLMASMLRR